MIIEKMEVVQLCVMKEEPRFYADNIGRVITNYVNEDGKSYAYISADLMGDACVGYEGVWSPDSIGY